MNTLLSRIFSSPWLLYAENSGIYGARLVSLIRGEQTAHEDFSSERAKHKPYVINLSDQTGATPMPYDPSQREDPNGPADGQDACCPDPCQVVVIPIHGELMKYDQFCGPRGTTSIANDIIAADNDMSVLAIVLHIDTPGGQSSYTDILCNAIACCETPVVAYVEGCAASAGYWIASAAKKIICSSELDMVGSIGSMLVWADMEGYLAKEGIVLHEVYATDSTEKNQAIADIKAGKYQPVRESLLDPIVNMFKSQVLARRPQVNPACMKGAIYSASDAIGMGLVDEIGSFQYAIQTAVTIPSEKFSNKTPNLTSHIMNIKMKATWLAIASFFGYTGDVTANDITPEMIDQLNDRLTDQNATIEAKDAEITRLTQISEDHISLQSTFAELTRQHEALLASDAGQETRAGKKADRTPEQIASDSYAHNKLADEAM